MSESVIKCEGVYKIFGNNAKQMLEQANGNVDAKTFQENGCIVGVNNASFEVAKGEMLVVMGLSGSGKSTLLRCISRLTDATSGKIFIEGQDLLSLKEKELIDHIKYPLSFIGKQIGILIPFFLLIFTLTSKVKFKIDKKNKKLIFLIFISVLPIFFMFLTSLISGSKIRTMWMTPFYLFFGVLFIEIYKKHINLKKLNKFFVIFFILLFLSPSLYGYISITKDNKRTDYPGKEIAELVERRWSKNFSNEIKYVIGDEWIAGNLSYHMSSRPIWFQDIKGKADQLDPSGGIVYTGNADILKQVCPGDFGKIKKQGFCMIGSK